MRAASPTAIASVLARRAAVEAGRLLLEHRAAWNEVTGTTEHDIKLRADRDAEAVILRILREGSSYPILSEESGELQLSTSSIRAHSRSSRLKSSVSDNNCRWIVDPLDGTVNYSRGTPLSAVSIALWNQDKPVYGVIYDFWRDELFHGGPGLGAFLGEQPVHASNVTAQGKAILTTGFPVNSDFAAESLLQFVESVRRFQKVRLLGSAALSLAYVACGRADAYMEQDIMLWDIAAGAAIVLGAGGTIFLEPSPRLPHACRMAAAASPALLEVLSADRKRRPE